MKTKDLIYTALFTAIICVLSPMIIPSGTVPITLATFAIYTTAAIRGRKGVLPVILYIAIGAIGVPVFSGFSAGIPKILGMTGGYIIGYIPCALIIGLMTEKTRRFWPYPVSMIIGTVVLYVIGTAWFMYITKNGLIPSLTMCVLPFLIGDAFKIAAASFLGVKLKRILFTI